MRANSGARCAKALDRPDLVAGQLATGRAGTAVRQQLAAIFAQQTQAHWVERLAGIECCVTPVLSLDEALADPQVRARDMIVGGADGVRQYAPPFRLSSHAFAIARPAPAQGEHSAEILREGGFSAEEVGSLRANSAYRGPPRRLMALLGLRNQRRRGFSSGWRCIAMLATAPSAAAIERTKKAARMGFGTSNDQESTFEHDGRIGRRYCDTSRRCHLRAGRATGNARRGRSRSTPWLCVGARILELAKQPPCVGRGQLDTPSTPDTRITPEVGADADGRWSQERAGWSRGDRDGDGVDRVDRQPDNPRRN